MSVLAVSHSDMTESFEDHLFITNPRVHRLCRSGGNKYLTYVENNRNK